MEINKIFGILYQILFFGKKIHSFRHFVQMVFSAIQCLFTIWTDNISIQQKIAKIKRN